MAAMTKPLPESLAKRINLSAAQPGLLRIQLGLPRDKSDVENHIFNEIYRRIEELDNYFGLAVYRVVLDFICGPRARQRHT